MKTPAETLVALENKFWQSMVDQDPNTAIDMLCEPALMVSAHGSMKFDHEGYRKMAEHGPMVLTSFELRDIDVTFPNDRMAVLTYRVKQGLAQRGQPESRFEEMNDSSTWVREGRRWKCVMHTETPATAH